MRKVLLGLILLATAHSLVFAQQEKIDASGSADHVFRAGVYPGKTVNELRIPLDGSAPTINGSAIVTAAMTAYANGLKTLTGHVDCSASAAPSVGQVPTATSATACTWQTPSGGGGSTPRLDQILDPTADKTFALGAHFLNFSATSGSVAFFDGTAVINIANVDADGVSPINITNAALDQLFSVGPSGDVVVGGIAGGNGLKVTMVAAGPGGIAINELRSLNAANGSFNVGTQFVDSNAATTLQRAFVGFKTNAGDAYSGDLLFGTGQIKSIPRIQMRLAGATGDLVLGADSGSGNLFAGGRLTIGDYSGGGAHQLDVTGDAAITGDLILGNGQILGGPGVGPNLSAVASDPIASTLYGTPVTIQASSATPGTSTPGADHGGQIVIVSGDAARLTSGDADGGVIRLITGDGIGAGHRGDVEIRPGNSLALSISGTDLSATFNGDLTTNGTLTAANFAGILSGTTGSIGGGLLTVGTCASGTASVTGAVVGNPVAVSASDGTLPGGLEVLSAAVTATNVVTVQRCAIATTTPAAVTYNVRILN